jgi:hypothetical protein
MKAATLDHPRRQILSKTSAKLQQAFMTRRRGLCKSVNVNAHRLSEAEHRS